MKSAGLTTFHPSHRCPNTSICHRWPSGLGISCTNVFNAARPAVPALTVAAHLTCSVVIVISDVEGSSLRRNVCRRYLRHDSQSSRTEGVHHRHSADSVKVEPWTIIFRLAKGSRPVDGDEDESSKAYTSLFIIKPDLGRSSPGVVV